MSSFPACFRWLRVTMVAALATCVLAAGCGGDKSGGPTGRPEDVVGGAVDKTLAAGTARIIITAPGADARGAIDFAAHAGQLSVTTPTDPKPAALIIAAGVGYAKSAGPSTRLAGAIPEALHGADPWADIDLIRGAVHIRSDGGNEVSGHSTIAYTLTVDPAQAVETTPTARQGDVRAALHGRSAPFTMRVWIDSMLLLRRIEVPTDFQATTPQTRIDGQPVAADIDYVTFGVTLGPITPPQTGG